MHITKDSRLKEIVTSYPWIIDEAVKIDGRFKALRSPLGRLLIAKADISEASRRTGIDSDTIIEAIEEMIRNHQP